MSWPVCLSMTAKWFVLFFTPCSHLVMCLSGGEVWVFRIGMIWCSVQEGQLSCCDSGVGPSVECRDNSASKRQLDIQPAMVPFWFGGVCGGGLIDGWNNGRWCGGIEWTCGASRFGCILHPLSWWPDFWLHRWSWVHPVGVFLLLRSTI